VAGFHQRIHGEPCIAFLPELGGGEDPVNLKAVRVATAAGNRYQFTGIKDPEDTV
jgi:hypothetical protein